ncbi:unnamed protein product [Urochloa humidicola]
MAALIRGVLRGRITAPITGRQRYLFNTSSKAFKDKDTERMSRDIRLMLVKAVADEAERMTIAHDSKINPFHWVYSSLGIPNKEFKPSSYWRMHLFFAYILCFSVGMEAGERHAKRLQEEYPKKSSSMFEVNR